LGDSIDDEDQAAVTGTEVDRVFEIDGAESGAVDITDAIRELLDPKVPPTKPPVFRVRVSGVAFPPMFTERVAASMTAKPPEALTPVAHERFPAAVPRAPVKSASRPRTP
jgi:hypothetical protein